MSNDNNGCCGGFEQNIQTAERTPKKKYLGLDDCGNKAVFNAKAGETYKWGMPVKLEGETVVPALDGVDAIGITLAENASAEDGDKVTVVRTGRFDWRDVALAIGKDPASMADWSEFYKAFNLGGLFVEKAL